MKNVKTIDITYQAVDENVDESEIMQKRPIDYFRHFIDDDILQKICDESNIYALQCNVNKPLKLTKGELEQFIGILFVMSICKMPSQRMYWRLETRYGKVADVMWSKRFEEIKKNLHFNGNNDFDNNDKLFKIRPFIDHLTSKFFYEEHVSIDEQTIPFKGRSLLKRYNKDKPKKWGYKVNVLCADDGRVLSFKIDTGKVERVLDNSDLGTTGNIVLWFMDRLADQGHKLYIDNWYNSADLAVHLKRLGTGLIGTVREDRLKGCKSFSSDSEMAKRVKRDGRGIMELSVAKEKDILIRCIKWHDNRAVKVLTNFASISQ